MAATTQRKPASSSKIVLIVIAAVFIIGGAGAGGAWWWWQHGSAEFKEGFNQAYFQGQERGAATDESACLSEAVSRLRSEPEPSMLQVIRDNLELSGCLEASRAVVTFCDGVPPKDELLSTVSWATHACTSRNVDSSKCGQTMKQVVDYCSSTIRAAKLQVR